ncbi:hypothetical protein MUK42_00531 [Musa troglodytarum]|uniref:Uncharacterized protein n=1 Tax=Musa troglodytarum TaxID=320322 RepID=A0A9E7JSB0_9LILI|nr:hypothetical protein MUK42_00531 [Musa troglodytarum]
MINRKTPLLPSSLMPLGVACPWQLFGSTSPSWPHPLPPPLLPTIDATPVQLTIRAIELSLQVSEERVHVLTHFGSCGHGSIPCDSLSISSRSTRPGDSWNSHKEAFSRGCY